MVDVTGKDHSPEQQPSRQRSALASRELTFMSHGIGATYLGSAVPHEEDAKEILETIDELGRISKLLRTKDSCHHKFLDSRCSWSHNFSERQETAQLRHTRKSFDKPTLTIAGTIRMRKEITNEELLSWLTFLQSQKLGVGTYAARGRPLLPLDLVP